jgi:hypothetical protein
MPCLCAPSPPAHAARALTALRRVQQDRLDLARAGRQARAEPAHGRHLVRARPQPLVPHRPHLGGARARARVHEEARRAPGPVRPRLHAPRRDGRGACAPRAPPAWNRAERAQNVCNGIHRSLTTNFRYALVWCVGGRFEGGVRRGGSRGAGASRPSSRRTRRRCRSRTRCRMRTSSRVRPRPRSCVGRPRSADAAAVFTK